MIHLSLGNQNLLHLVLILLTRYCHINNMNYYCQIDLEHIPLVSFSSSCFSFHFFLISLEGECNGLLYKLSPHFSSSLTLNCCGAFPLLCMKGTLLEPVTHIYYMLAKKTKSQPSIVHTAIIRHTFGTNEHRQC